MRHSDDFIHSFRFMLRNYLQRKPSLKILSRICRNPSSSLHSCFLVLRYNSHTVKFTALREWCSSFNIFRTLSMYSCYEISEQFHHTRKTPYPFIGSHSPIPLPPASSTQFLSLLIDLFGTCKWKHAICVLHLLTFSLCTVFSRLIWPAIFWVLSIFISEYYSTVWIKHILYGIEQLMDICVVFTFI